MSKTSETTKQFEHETLTELPPHFIQHVGEVAISLTHRDQHPQSTSEYDGGTYVQVDFSKRILDDESPEVEFADKEIQAARNGEAKLAELLHDSSTLLALAHAKLVAEGQTFTAPLSETPDEIKLRHKTERSLIAKTAYAMAYEQIITASESGNSEAVEKELDRLNTIIYLAGEHYNDRAAHKVYRKLVHQGLATEMVESLRRATEIGSDVYTNISKPLSSTRSILELATGRKLDYDFSDKGELDYSSLERNLSGTPLLEATAVVTSPNLGLTQEQRVKIIDSLSNWTQQKKLKEQLEKFGDYSEAGELYDLAEDCESEGSDQRTSFFNENIGSLLEVDSPIDLHSIAKELDLPLTEAARVLTFRSETDFSTKYLNRVLSEQMVTIKARYPSIYGLMLEQGKQSRLHADYSEMLSVLESISELGINNEQVNRFLMNIGDNLDATTAEAALRFMHQYASSHEMSIDELILKTQNPGSPGFIAYGIAHSLGSTEQLSDKSGDSESSPEGIIERSLIESSIYARYHELYSKAHYPLSPDAVKGIKLGLESFPEVSEKLQKLGIDAELSSALFASWATFNALQKKGFDDVSGFKTIGEIPNKDEMNEIVKEQMRAIYGQLRALEKYVHEFGSDETLKLIDIFGIYNFNRHSSAQLHDQLQRWESGMEIKNVVAEARADWNSYTGKLVKFEDDSEKPGIFYFEVNSPTELARLAVRIGARERACGREPDVSRFIVHAHGNPTGLLLGVNREMLNITSYADAARRRAKIPGSESNQYKRHLGPNYQIILQSCSAAGKSLGGNIASTMAENLNVPVTGAEDTITGLIITADGEVQYEAGYQKTTGSVTY